MQIRNAFEFVLLKNSFVGKIKLFIKGADSMIRDRLAKNKVDYEEITWKQLEVGIFI
jgi:hypothetical protein